MTDENKIRDAADAVTGLVKAVPVYQDVLQPAAQEIGSGLQTLAKTIHIALAPVAGLVWGYEQIKDFVATRVAEKLKDVPPERIQPPDPHVVGPALESLRYTGHEENLRELYANLLATSLDAATATQAHPAFVDMIDNMSPDEARIMRLFAVRNALPLIHVHVYKSKDVNEYVVVCRAFSFIGREAGCAVENLTPNYLDNLTRLGLLETPGGTGLGGVALSAPNTYEPLEQHFAALRESIGAAGRVDTERSFIRTTDLGKQFCRACVIEKSVSA